MFSRCRFRLLLYVFIWWCVSLCVAQCHGWTREQYVRFPHRDFSQLLTRAIKFPEWEENVECNIVSTTISCCLWKSVIEFIARVLRCEKADCFFHRCQNELFQRHSSMIHFETSDLQTILIIHASMVIHKAFRSVSRTIDMIYGVVLIDNSCYLWQLACYK